jgi:hypothetical protein
MSPESITHSGGTVGRAASGTANRRDAACTDDLHVLARCAAVVSLALCMLVFNAPTLWPHLFAH